MEFDEWATDLSYNRTGVTKHIPGFNKVHHGFKERIFPNQGRSPKNIPEHIKAHLNDLKALFTGTEEKKPPTKMPYDTCKEGIQILADHLCKKNGLDKVNVYFTGHSLGCGLATMTYARAVKMRDTDFESNIDIRDAYLFAAPVVSDVESKDHFNEMMAKDPRRTLWRVTNASDAVATLLPELGDVTPSKDLIVESINALAFAHLGTEIKMDPPTLGAHARAVVGGHIPRNTPVRVVSSLLKTDFADSGKYKLGAIASIPMVGPVAWLLAAHAVTCYWDSIILLEPGECKWVID